MNYILATVAYIGIGLVSFILGQISLQKKIERRTGVVHRNYTQTELIIQIGQWKLVWDAHLQQEKEAFIHKGGGNDESTKGDNE